MCRKKIGTRLMAFKNGVLRRIFGPRMEDVTGEWRKLHSEQVNGLYPPPNTIWVIELRRMIWAGQVAGEVYARFWWGNLWERTTWKTEAQMGG